MLRPQRGIPAKEVTSPPILHTIFLDPAMQTKYLTHTLFLVLLMSILALPGRAVTIAQVPPGVSKTLYERAPQAELLEWHESGENNYVAAYTFGSKKARMLISTEGQWQGTFYQVHSREMPEGYQSVVNDFEGHELLFIGRGQRKDGSTVFALELMNKEAGSHLMIALNDKAEIAQRHLLE